MPACVRADALPEAHTYADEGCDFHPRCLTCPAPVCRFDAPAGVRTLRNTPRDQAIVQGRLELGLSAQALADHYGISERRVWGILQAHRSLLHG